MSYAYVTDKGKFRNKNEDFTTIIENKKGDIFMMVMDGMGGHLNGDLASQKTCKILQNYFMKKRKFIGYFSMRHFLKSSLKKVNNELRNFSLAQHQNKGMGTTFVGYLIHRNKIVCAYIGDSRAYFASKDKLTQISHDETYVQYLIKQKKITEDEAKNHPSRHVITNALGSYPKLSLNLINFKSKYKYLLLCSDGLYNCIEEHKILEVLESNSDLKLGLDKLINIANENGGSDNISIAVLKKDN